MYLIYLTECFRFMFETNVSQQGIEICHSEVCGGPKAGGECVFMIAAWTQQLHSWMKIQSLLSSLHCDVKSTKVS